MRPEAILEACRTNLLAYACAINPSYQMPKHLVQIARVLHRVERGEAKRVILTIPPRHGKSLLCSQYFPAWYLGRNPNKYLITSTYGQELSDDFGRAVRNQTLDPLYQAIFPGAKLAKDSQASSRFNTEAGGSYFATGVGGAVTGRGAHLLLIDDPVKNREDAESSNLRRKVQEWYSSVAYTRLMPGGSVFVIGTRWHNDDLIGWLMKEHSHESWEVINLKAIDDEGNALWPEAYPIETLEQIKRAVGPYDWNSLYQQSPVNKDTMVLDASKITGYETLPKILMTVTACDPAISKDKKACNTAFSTLGFGQDGHIYDLETTGNQYTFLETLQHAENLVKRQKPLHLGVEDNGYQAALAEVCTRSFPLINVSNIRAIKDKYLRAKSVSHLIEKGLFHTNNQELLDEIINFDPEATGVTRKDRVDAMVHALHMIQQYAPLDYSEKKPENYELRGMSPFQQMFRICEAQEKARLAGESRVINFDRSVTTNIDPDYY